MKQKKTFPSQDSTQQNNLGKNADLNHDQNVNGVVEYGKATQLTKGSGGRNSGQGYTRP